MNKQALNSTIFFTFIIGCLFLFILHPSIFYPQTTDDEKIYIAISNGLHSEGIDWIRHHPDSKPISFLSIEYLLKGSVIYTRILNYILIGITTYFIFKVTSSKLSFLYPAIPFALYGQTLNDWIIPAMFIVMSLYYADKCGIFTGLAAVFNPFSVLYLLMLDKKNWIYALIVCGIYANILIYSNLLLGYLVWLIKYESIKQTQYVLDWFAIIFLVLFFVINVSNRKMFYYGLLSAIPILTRPDFNSYYIVAYTVLFVGYLQTTGSVKSLWDAQDC